MHKVFVYGTLLSGQGNNYRLQNEESKLLDKVIIDIPFQMHDMGPFPALVESEINTIVGEIWEISDWVLQSLDALEGYPHFYDRKEIDTNLGKAWVYFCNSAIDEPIIQCGDWIFHIKGE